MTSDYDQMIEWGMRAIAIDERNSGGFFAILRAYYWKAIKSTNSRDWEKAIYWGEHALQAPVAQSVLPHNPELQHNINYYMNIVYSKIGNIEKAIECSKILVKNRPDDQDMKTNLRLHEENWARIKNGTLI